MTGGRIRHFLLVLTVLAFLGCLAGGCSRSQTAESNQTAGETEAASETKALAPGEGEQGARVEFVNREHKMERVIFSGGYLRSLPEEKPETILRPAPEGAQGMIFGKREINGLEWAKVATRDGVTGWDAVPAKEGAGPRDKRNPLKITNDGYETTFPQVTGGVAPQVQDRINQELGNYLSVYRHITGPVESELQCQVTYNRRQILSLVFQGTPILYRSYPVSEVNSLASWTRLKNYAYVSSLQGGADPTLLVARITDLHYALVFDLATGSRLTLDYFLGANRQEELQERLAGLGEGARLQKDDFYITTQGRLVALASVPGKGRVDLDLSDLVIREF